MTISEPNDDDLRALIGDLELGVVDFIDHTQLTDIELITHYHSVQQELKDLGELIEARTEAGKDLHSRHGAVFVEMTRRGLR